MNLVWKSSVVKHQMGLWYFRCRDIQLGRGLILKVPQDAEDIQCEVAPLDAEQRTLLLDDLAKCDSDIMVSDMYKILANDFPKLESGADYKLQLPLDLPDTKLDKRELFNFIVHKKKELWNCEDTEYQV